MIALIVVGLGAVAAAVGTGVLTARATQMTRIYFLAWTAALFGLAIGLGATTLGYLAGFGGLTFRVMELGTQLLAPLSLCLAMVETSGRGLPARFAMRLAVSGLGVIALVILATDPLNPNVTFGTTWPDPTIVYQIAPLTVLGVLALFTAVTAAATIGLTMVRSSRERSPKEEQRPLILVGVAALALAVPGLSWLLDKGLGFGLPLPAKDLFALCCVTAAFLIWYAARMAGQRNLGHVDLRPSSGTPDDDDWDDDYARGSRSSYRSYETGGFDRYEDPAYRGRRRTDDGRLYEEPNSDFHYPGLAALAAEHEDVAGDPDRRRDGDDRYADSGSYDSAAFDSAAFDSAAFDSVAFDSAALEADLGDSVQFGLPAPYQERDRYDDYYPDGQPEEEPSGQMFGQITIYTLIEGRTDDFDRLTEWVVAQVRSKEPDTLVYIVHAVPTAPMQRILYEVYRDRTAHDQHLLRSYVQTYYAEQRPCVLAANVIELDLQQAKVTPLPTFSAISDMLSESGIDLTGITKSSPPPFGYQRALPAGGTAQYEHEYEPQPEYDQRQYGNQQYNDQPQYDQPQYDRRQYDPPQYDRHQYEPHEYDRRQIEQRQIEQRPYEQGPHEQHGYDERHYQPGHYQRDDYDQGNYDQGSYDQGSYEQGDYGQHRYPEPEPEAEPEYEQPGYERPYQGGWADLRGEETRY
jgi:quinol monooxygenase YgiN